MVGACRLHFDGEAGGAGVGQLLGMDARHQTSGTSGSENSAGLCNRECAAVAENVAEFGEAGHGYRGNPAFDEQVHVRIGPAAKFRGHDVRAEKRGVDIERVLLMQFREQRQNLEFAFPVEAVAAF